MAWWTKGYEGVCIDGRKRNLFGKNRQGGGIVPEELETELIDLMAQIGRSGEEINATVLRPSVLAYPLAFQKIPGIPGIIFNFNQEPRIAPQLQPDLTQTFVCSLWDIYLVLQKPACA